MFILIHDSRVTCVLKTRRTHPDPRPGTQTVRKFHRHSVRTRTDAQLDRVFAVSPRVHVRPAGNYSLGTWLRPAAPPQISDLSVYCWSCVTRHRTGTGAPPRSPATSPRCSRCGSSRPRRGSSAGPGLLLFCGSLHSEPCSELCAVLRPRSPVRTELKQNKEESE